MTPETTTASTTSRSGPIYILTAALLWSTAGLLIKYIPWHPLAIASLRSLIAATVFVAAFGRSLFKRPNHLTIISGVALVMTQTLFVVANKLTTATNAIMLQYTSPAFIMILGMLFYHYRPKRREVIAMIWAFAGIALFFFGKLTPGNLIGNAMAVFTGLTFAVVFILNGRPECQASLALFIGQIGTFLVGLPMVFLLDPADIKLMPVLSIVVLGLFQLGLSYFLFNRGIIRTAPLNASLLAMVEPLMSPVWVFLFLREVPTVVALIGAAVVISAMLYLNLGAKSGATPGTKSDVKSGA